jgi:hypothetical protein
MRARTEVDAPKLGACPEDVNLGRDRAKGGDRRRRRQPIGQERACRRSEPRCQVGHDLGIVPGLEPLERSQRPSLPFSHFEVWVRRVEPAVDRNGIEALRQPRKDAIDPGYEPGRRELKRGQSPLVAGLDPVERALRKALAHAAVVHAQPLGGLVRREARRAKDRVLEGRPRDRVLEAELETVEREAASLEELGLLPLEGAARIRVRALEAALDERDLHRPRDLLFGGADAMAFEDLENRSHVPTSRVRTR